jgi:hypothetical protein
MTPLSVPMSAKRKINATEFCQVIDPSPSTVPRVFTSGIKIVWETLALAMNVAECSGYRPDPDWSKSDPWLQPNHRHLKRGPESTELSGQSRKSNREVTKSLFRSNLFTERPKEAGEGNARAPKVTTDYTIS